MPKVSLPRSIERLVSGAELRPVSIGCSGARVWRVLRPGAPDGDWFLKSVYSDDWFGAREEAQRLEWLQGRLPAPQVIHFEDDGRREHLLTTAVPGSMACDAYCMRDEEALVEAFAANLRLIHATPIDDCPFDLRLDRLLELAEDRAELGLVDESEFYEEHQRWSALDLIDELRDRRPKTEDLVFCHGDYCLPNVLLNEDTLALGGFIDWGMAGISERWRDLAIAMRSIEYNLDKRCSKIFLRAYGVPLNERLKKYHQALYEFF
jgi:aminoglycoside phosphotransferase